MKRILILAYTLTLYVSATYGQSFNKSINKDSLFQTILKNIPEQRRADLIKEYNSGSEKEKEFFLFMLSMPRSSKKELISNIDSNYAKVNYLKNEYAKLVPPNYTVMIEFNPEDKIINDSENIDLRITLNENGGTQTFQDWRLRYNSDTLNKMLGMIHWNNKTLDTIKKLLSDAHCVSVENGEIATIGFARSGMGKYFYKLFDNDLTKEQIKQNNDGCTDIFYKRNIVLEYSGGAIGSQCFPD